MSESKHTKGPSKRAYRHHQNSRLVAAAPDLLEACIEAEDVLSEEGESNIVDLLRAAIAKATGK